MTSLLPKTILSLCDYSGIWSQPYVDAGYDVIRVDLAYPAGRQQISDRLWHMGLDMTDWVPDSTPYGVLAAPPCCCFCRPGARWWTRMDRDGSTDVAIRLMRACLRICRTATGWWALENPPGRHQRLISELGPPAWQWQPWHYGDLYHKQTYIWGTAKQPPATNSQPPERITYRTPNGRTQGRIARMSSSWKREREKTPAGFAKAFFLANP